jgi:hypothetical protein
MRITEIITPLVLAALVAVAAPAASFARPLDGARPTHALAFGIATDALLLSATALTVGRLSTQPPGSLRS